MISIVLFKAMDKQLINNNATNSIDMKDLKYTLSVMLVPETDKFKFRDFANKSDALESINLDEQSSKLDEHFRVLIQLAKKFTEVSYINERLVTQGMGFYHNQDFNNVEIVYMFIPQRFYYYINLYNNEITIDLMTKPKQLCLIYNFLTYYDEDHNYDDNDIKNINEQNKQVLTNENEISEEVLFTGKSLLCYIKSFDDIKKKYENNFQTLKNQGFNVTVDLPLKQKNSREQQQIIIDEYSPVCKMFYDKMFSYFNNFFYLTQCRYDFISNGVHISIDLEHNNILVINLVKNEYSLDIKSNGWIYVSSIREKIDENNNYENNNYTMILSDEDDQNVFEKNMKQLKITDTTNINLINLTDNCFKALKTQLKQLNTNEHKEYDTLQKNYMDDEFGKQSTEIKRLREELDQIKKPNQLKNIGLPLLGLVLFLWCVYLNYLLRSTRK